MVLHPVEIVGIDIADLNAPLDEQFGLGAEFSLELAVVGIAGVKFLGCAAEKAVLIDQAGHGTVGQHGPPAIALPFAQRAQVGTQAPVGMSAAEGAGFFYPRGDGLDAGAGEDALLETPGNGDIAGVGHAHIVGADDDADG